MSSVLTRKLLLFDQQVNNYFVKMSEIKKSNAIIEELKLCLQKKEEEIAKLQKLLASQELSKSETVEFIKKQLPMLTENQIKLMTKQKKKVYWTTGEIATGFTLSYFNSRGYNYLIQKLEYPLPAIRTLNDWAQKLTIAPGILNDVLFMLKNYAQTLTEAERQVMNIFDH